MIENETEQGERGGGRGAGGIFLFFEIRRKQGEKRIWNLQVCENRSKMDY